MPSRTKTENTGPPDAGKMSVEPAKGEHREFKCPNCGGLVYSRKARVCGNCGETLSPEVGLSVDQRRLLDEQREWARDLADRFGTQNPRVTSRNSARPAAAEGIVRPMSWTAELLRRKSCAEEFRTRDRPDFWLYVAGYIFLLAISAFAFVAVGHFSPLALSVMIGLCAFYCYRAWQHATPICPNCQENIRSCAPFYCHICGNPLEDQRCGNCRVNYSRNSLLFSFANDGNSGLVAYCPACGVELRTRIRRRGERGLSLTENRK